MSLNLFSTLDSPILNTTNGYVNVTLDQFKPLWSSGLVLSNTILFLILFSIYLLVLIGFIIRVTRKLKLKRNQIILFVLAGIYVSVQIIGLVLRIVFVSLNLVVRSKVEQGDLIEWRLFVTLQVFTGLNTFPMFNFVTLLSIVMFVQNMFWNTATLMRAISKQASKILRTTMSIVGTIFVVVAIIIIILTMVLAGIMGFNLVSPNIIQGIQVSVFVIAGLMILFVSGMLVSSGIIVIRMIRQTCKNVVHAVENHKSEKHLESQSTGSSRISFDKTSFEKKVQNPFKITVGLLIGLVLCIGLTFVAIAIAAGSSVIGNYEIIWQFLNCSAVLTFGILILFLFYPLFRDMENALKEIEKRNEMLKTKKEKMQSNIKQTLSVSNSENNFLSLPSSSCGDMTPTSPAGSAISFSSEVEIIPLEHNDESNVIEN